MWGTLAFTICRQSNRCIGRITADSKKLNLRNRFMSTIQSQQEKYLESFDWQKMEKITVFD